MKKKKTNKKLQPKAKFIKNEQVNKLAPPPPKGAEELPSHIEMRCPHCMVHWANASIVFGKEIRKEDFSVREDLKKKVVFQKNGLPICPCCNFRYEERAMYALLMAASNVENQEKRLWGTTVYEKQ